MAHLSIHGDQVNIMKIIRGGYLCYESYTQYTRNAQYFIFGFARIVYTGE